MSVIESFVRVPPAAAGRSRVVRLGIAPEAAVGLRRERARHTDADRTVEGVATAPLIARVDRPLDGVTIDAPDATPVPSVASAAPRRAGGLPLPGRTAPSESDRAAGAHAAAVRWNCRFPSTLEVIDVSQEHPQPARRAGGLPLPAKGTVERGESSARDVVGVRAQAEPRAQQARSR